MDSPGTVCARGLAHTSSQSLGLENTREDSKNPVQGRKRYSKYGESWTRSGCLTCKKRRKKCDEAKPGCLNCAKLGRTCEGYGTIWTEPLNPSTNVFQKAASPKFRKLNSLSPESHQLIGIRKDSKAAASSSVLYGCHCVADNDLLCSPESISSSSETETENSNDHIELDSILPTPKPRGSLSHLSSPEMFYLQYHTERGSKLLANLEIEQNPLRALIIPRALSSPLVMDAVCAVSAIHMSKWAMRRDSWAQTAAMKYYGRTISRLRGLLTEPLALSPYVSTYEDVIVAIAWLCKYEIVRGSVKQWRGHLDALQKVITSRGGFGSIDLELAEFIRGLVTYFHNVAKVTSRKYANTVVPYDRDSDARKLDSYMGYAEDLVMVCARISDLPFINGGPHALALEISTISDTLENWTSTKRLYIMPKGITRPTLARLEMVADSFRYAAFIYLHSILERMSQGSTAALSIPSLSALVHITKSDALHRCLVTIEATPLDDHCEYSALAFPLFMAGCESQTVAQQGLVLQSLDKLEQSFGIGNIGRAKELLKRVWGWNMNDQERTKRHWLDVLEDSGWELIMA